MPRLDEKPGFFSKKHRIFKEKYEIIGEKVRDYWRKNIKKERNLAKRDENVYYFSIK